MVPFRGRAGEQEETVRGVEEECRFARFTRVPYESMDHWTLDVPPRGEKVKT